MKSSPASGDVERTLVESYDTLRAEGWFDTEPDALFAQAAQLIEDMAATLGACPTRDLLLARRAMMHGHAGQPDAVMVADHLAFLHGMLGSGRLH
ncbi:hypothetical protein [Magnetospirillum moscoviense]|uniref:Uncharacterized protein n=1 Tax=Magnetospirillum moscoviense TaxID=1437059 RepID=A0A178ML52_9PROT|nr:hypothetical protein [Magnetospirillum moscoviense]MBF0326845.1 hypothetical protein [Alphaproteobacteria bacterium]OAN49396.1 hypothetical protein A6A05_14050 [Magnetospirillum moscoviense]